MAENSGDILDKVSESGPEHIKPVLKPRSFVSSQKPETLESKKPRNNLGRKVALTLAAIMALKGVGETVNDITNSAKGDYIDNTPLTTEDYKTSSSTDSAAESVEPTPDIILESNIESDKASYEKQIEEKYGIEILNQREGYRRIGKNYDEIDEETMGHRPVVRWPKEQLIIADQVLSYFPKSFFEAKDGKKLAISLWDYGSKEEYAGMYHSGANMISVNENSFTNLGATAQLMAHELGHKKDSEKLKNKLHEIVDEDKAFLNNKFFHVDGRFYSKNPDIAQVVATFKNMIYESDGETRANFFQTYIKGYERFMHAVGPVIDGGKVRVNIPRDKLALKYPRAQEIYELFMEVFEGKEYDALQNKLDPYFRYPNTIS